MNKEETKEILKISLDEVNHKISVLCIRKKELEDRLIEVSDNFIDKFLIWYNNGEECHEDFVLSSEEFPLTMKLLKESYDINKYAVYDIEKIIGEDDMWAIEEKEEYLSQYSIEEYDELVEKISPVLKELMDGNVKSFTYDW